MSPKKISKEKTTSVKSNDIFTFDKEFDHLISSMPGIIWVNTMEEERLIQSIINNVRKVVEGNSGPIGEQINDVSVHMWSLASGLHSITESVDPLLEDKIDKDTMQPVPAIDYIVHQYKSNYNLKLFIMRGLGELIKIQPVIARKLKNVYKALYRNNKIIIITAINSEIPPTLDKNITYYHHKPMNRNEISSYVENIINTMKAYKSKNIKVDYTDVEINDIVNACLGLSENEIRKIFNQELNKSNQINIGNIIKEKKRAIEKSGVLQYWDHVESMKNVGGLGELKKWLKKRKNCLSQEARNFGLPVPRGILIVGVPGCGKSLCAKAVANEWELPLIRMDVGKIMGSLVGQSEQNIRMALDLCDSSEPVILWLDELEKNLSGSASSNYSDSGTMSRVFGTFTTWLQEKQSYVFVIATANDISQLPPELTRKGRLDEIWYVGLPTEEERKEIFKIQISKYGRNPSKFKIDELAKIQYKDKNKTFKYTGSEIEEAVKDSLYTVFDKDPKSDITTKDVKRSLSEIVPLAKSESERVNKIISHGVKHYRQASSDVEKIKTIKKEVDFNL